MRTEMRHSSAGEPKKGTSQSRALHIHDEINARIAKACVAFDRLSENIESGF